MFCSSFNVLGTHKTRPYLWLECSKSIHAFQVNIHKTNHIEVDRLFIKEKLKGKIIEGRNKMEDQLQIFSKRLFQVISWACATYMHQLMREC